ncbi:MAG TPA: alpha/beta fold hydrolase [Jatrophihabitans sp.]
MSSDIRPFRIAVPDGDIEDLHRRLAQTRWPDVPRDPVWDDPGWEYGVSLPFLRELCAYWAGEYDWRGREEMLNTFDQYTTQIDGTGVHFVHVRSAEPGARPILLSHGWPGSYVEFRKVIAPLTDPLAHGGKAEDAFHVVVPSLPGFGFSGPTRARGWDTRRMAHAFAELMGRLGYEHFIAQGGDWGASISHWLGLLYPERVDGVHLSTVALRTEVAESFADTTAQEQESLERYRRYYETGAGYVAIQSTRPHTLGVGLDDSPAGTCAWILDKFWDWSEHRGNVLDSFTRDELLDNVSIYWFTRTSTSAARIYYEAKAAGTNVSRQPAPPVPMGAAIFPAEISRPSLRWVQQSYDVIHYERLARGGHFGAYEAPEEFVAAVRGFRRELEQRC